jgi:hypothetical protein
VLAGVGAARMPVLAVVVVLASGAITVGDLRDQAHDVQARADRREALGELVRTVGRQALTRCRVRTAPDVRPLVASQLDISMLGIDRPPQRPDVVLRWRPHGGGPVQPKLDPAGYRLLAHVPGWEAWDGCAN